MTELPHVDSFDPEDKDGLASPSKSENSATTATSPSTVATAPGPSCGSIISPSPWASGRSVPSVSTTRNRA